MADAQLRALLLEKNAWWRDPDVWRRDDPYFRETAEAPIDYRPDPLVDIQPPGLYVLTGPRRVGKSLELRRKISGLIDDGVSPRRIVYCSCDGFRAQDLRRIFTVGRNLSRTADGPRYWMIDEVTEVRDWASVIADLRNDSELRGDCVVLSGSSARQFREATKKLAGRRGGATDSDRLLLPMTFATFCTQIGVQGIPDLGPVLARDLYGEAARERFDELEPWSSDLTNAWESYLLVGGYPRSIRDFLDHGDIQPDFLQEIWDVIRGEAIKTTSLSDTELVSFLTRIGESLTTPLNASAVARDAGLGNHHRVNDRVNDLCFAFLAWQTYQHDDGKALPKAFRKVYFSDPIVARIPNHLNARHPRPDDAKLSEQQLGLLASRALERQRPGSLLNADAVFYERSPTGEEIDFVGADLEIPIESKYVDGGWKREAQTAEAAYGRGVLATRSVYDTSGPVWAVPAAIVAWLLG